MKRLNVLSVALKSGEFAFVDKSNNCFQFYNRDGQALAAKLNSLFDIITLRDLLNDAYPPEVYASAVASKNQSVRQV
ncbi:hypothetical protein D3C72_247440 [compost metagenome]